jgi:hypothetical protein
VRRVHSRVPLATPRSKVRSDCQKVSLDVFRSVEDRESSHRNVRCVDARRCLTPYLNEVVSFTRVTADTCWVSCAGPPLRAPRGLSDETWPPSFKRFRACPRATGVVVFRLPRCDASPSACPVTWGLAVCSAVPPPLWRSSGGSAAPWGGFSGPVLRFRRPWGVVRAVSAAPGWAWAGPGPFSFGTFCNRSVLDDFRSMVNWCSTITCTPGSPTAAASDRAVDSEYCCLPRPRFTPLTPSVCPSGKGMRHPKGSYNVLPYAAAGCSPASAGTPRYHSALAFPTCRVKTRRSRACTPRCSSDVRGSLASPRQLGASMICGSSGFYRPGGDTQKADRRFRHSALR